MMRNAYALALVFLPLSLAGQGIVSLPAVTVYSPQVANQIPEGTFAMPVSALRYEPRVDIQARNLTEGQADVTIRGGIFENSGFRLGAISLWDPQTGHYFAEIPVAPAMLTSPSVVTGADLATGAMNATAGVVTYGWRPVRTAGLATIAFGEDGFLRQELYQGYLTDVRIGGCRLAGDVGVAHSKSDGPIANGDHEFDRINFRLQLQGDSSQMDLFGGYQAKFFGWPNLYTPFGSPETEDLETVLVAANYRVDFGADDFLEAGSYYRRHKDDYAYNRFAPVGPVHPFQHTTWVSGVAASGRRTSGALVWNFHAEVLADEIRSTSLTFGRFHSRTFLRAAVVPEWNWTSRNGGRTTLKAGVAGDDTNRGRMAVSPVFELARERASQVWRRIHFSYVRTTQVPTYTALNSNAAAGLFRGNPDLGRMASHGFELGVGGMVAGWSTEAALFLRRDKRLVDWTFRRGVTARTANAVDMDVGGVELFTRKTWSTGEVGFGWTLLGKDADYRGAAVDASFYALNYARHRLTAAVVFHLPGGFELRLDNVARLQAENLLRTIGGDDAVTSSLGLVFRPAALRGLDLILRIENLWDNRFQEIPAVPASPRQGSIGALYTW